MRNDINFFSRERENVLQDLLGRLAHDDDARGKRQDLLHDPPLVCTGLAENRMKGGNDGHLERAQQWQDMTAGRPAKNAEFMLERDYPDVADIQEIGGPFITSEVLFLDLESHLRRIIVALLQIVDRHHEALGLPKLGGDRV